MWEIKAQITRKAEEHAKRATELLRQSQAFHQAKKVGLIEENAANHAVIELNRQAIEEIDQAIELQRIFIEKSERKAH